jgi:hypothetical protein
MLIFRKERDKTNQFDTTNVVVESTAITLPDILEDFKEFLMACGYSIKPSEDLVIYDTKEDE